jgi:hypothetical protein
MVLALLSSSLFGCAGEPIDDCTTGDSQVWVMRQIAFARFEDDIAPGFDLDDSTGKVCGHDDWESPWGSEGVDNNFARLIPALESTEAVAVEAILLQTINSGELLIILQAENVDSYEDDSCLGVEVTRGEGPVEVGTDELLLPGQTLALDPAAEVVLMQTPFIEAGVLQARGFSMSLPFQVLNEAINFDIRQGQLRMEVDPETLVAHGYAGGGINVADILALVDDLGVDAEVKDLLNGILPAMADLDGDGDGECEDISMALEFEAVPTWLY